MRKETKRAVQEDIAFKVTVDGHVDMGNKNVPNLGEPTKISATVRLYYIEDNCLIYLVIV